MNNYKLVIQYNGKNYSGWQIQKNAVSVQGKITEAIHTLLRVNVNLVGSGRTDTGVHALGQIANFRHNEDLDLYKFHYSLNSLLPNDISIQNIAKVNENFHARFDALKRSYIYLITGIKSPFFYDYSYYYLKLDLNKVSRLNEVSKILMREDDFTSFSKRNTETKNNNCNIMNIHWRKSKYVTIFFIEADRFLHGMVRAIVGTLLYAVENNFDQDYILDIIGQKDREKASMAVPAKGLFLYKVTY